MSSCVWAPDGQTFVVGCLDKERNLSQWNLHGDMIYDWGRNHRIQDIAVSPNGHYLVAMDNETHLHVYNFVTRELEYELDMKTTMTSVSISQNSRYLLVNKTDGEAQMLDLDTQATVRSFKSGAKGGNFVIRATYGGANESFVIFGSEGKTPHPYSITTELIPYRWPDFHLAQGDRPANREIGRAWQSILQFCSLES